MKVIYTEEKKNCYFIFYPPQQILSFDSIELPRKKKISRAATRNASKGMFGRL